MDRTRWIFPVAALAVLPLLGCDSGGGGSGGPIDAESPEDDSLPALSPSHAEVSEGRPDGTARFSIALSAPSKEEVKVDFRTRDGTAAAGRDYVKTEGTLVFAPGIRALDVEVRVLDDREVEGNEEFFLRLSSPSNAEIAEVQTSCTIIDDEADRPDEELFGLDDRPRAGDCLLPDPPPASSALALEPVFESLRGLSIGKPLALRMPRGASSHWYLVDRLGRIFRFRNEPGADSVDLCLDLRSRVTVENECGMLDIAFHPGFGSNGQAFVFFTEDDGGDAITRISRFTTRDGGRTFDPDSEKVLLSVPQRTHHHKGGTLAFGPDGYLYIALGEDGTRPNSQDLDVLKGKMLRIDPNRGDPYAIPPDNPLVNRPGLDEIFAWGFRNPWRWSFDTVTGELWLGDVGAAEWEEINVVTRGGNYGWPVRDGAHCFMSGSCETEGFIDPVVEWSHSSGGRAAVGGHVYRGRDLPEIEGAYVYADWGQRRIWALLFDGAGRPAPVVLANLEAGVVIFSLAQDNDGEIYIVTGGSRFFRLASRGGSGPSSFPGRISELPCLDPREVAAGSSPLIPYEINVSFWSDGAEKRRAFLVPDGKRIRVKADGDWEFPVGSVLVKTFLLGGRRIETRVLARHSSGDWGGYSFEWQNDGQDAVLLLDHKTGNVGGRTWTFPGRSECFQCHTDAAGVVLGLETSQMNRLFTYPSTGRTRNQIATLDFIGLLDGPIPADVAGLPVLPSPDDARNPIADRARAYLHVNCSGCHRPDASGRGPADMRFDVPFEDMGLCGVTSLENEDQLLFDPRSPVTSAILLRIRSLDERRMPPLASHLIDVRGVAVIDGWIRSVSSCPD